MISRKLVAASSIPIVLSVLSQGESYGYAIIQRVRALSSGRIEWTEGMLYPVLHRLAEDGLIEAEWRQAETGRKRKYYRIAERGREVLSKEREEWQAVHSTLDLLWGAEPCSA